MRKGYFQIGIFILLIMTFTMMLEAQPEDISISSRVDKSRITIGDLVRYKVTVTHNENVQVEMPGLGVNLGGFEIRDYHVQEPYKKDGIIISEADYIISTFLTGEFEIPPLTISYTTMKDSVVQKLTTEKIQIIVESVKPSEAGDIRDIKPPVEIPRDWWQFYRWFILAALFVILSILGYILYQRKKQGKRLLPLKQEPSQPPHEIAYEKLDHLRHSDLLEKGLFKDYYTEISEIIRNYIEGRYFVIAMEMTTFEVLEGLSGADLSEEEYQLFSVFFSQCDLVKFAKYIPSEKENEEIMDLAFEIVNKTKVIIDSSLKVTEDGSIQSDKKGEDEKVSPIESVQKTEESHVERGAV